MQFLHEKNEWVNQLGSTNPNDTRVGGSEIGQKSVTCYLNLPFHIVKTHFFTYITQISVKDANDNRPIFEQDVYNATVRESLPIGSSIVTLRASDLDYDANGKVTYLLESEGEENFFRIDANTGVISLRSALDRELRSQHILNVIASGEKKNQS